MISVNSDSSPVYQNPVNLLQNLIRFDTTNPPGNESECIKYIQYLLNQTGIESAIIARDIKRPNLIARLPGRGNVPPLLLYGHVDVATTENQVWKYPPFEARIAEGNIWGRGALDMKGGIAMMLAAFLRARAEGTVLPGDVILAIVSDEERGGEFGAKFLVDNHANYFKNVRYAIGEFGGFSFYIGKKKLFPIMVAEKQPCVIGATLQGPSGHPTAAYHGGVMARLGQVLQLLEKCRLPVHITVPTSQMMQAISRVLPFPSNLVIRQLLNPKLTGGIIKILGAQVEQFETLLCNNVNVSTINGAYDPWRIPDKISLTITCNLLPGYTPDDAMSEIHSIVGKGLDLKVLDTQFCQPTTADPDMGLFDTLTNILKETEPDCIPCPLLSPGPTDGRTFAKLGIQTYGFLPMNLPPDFAFWQMMHGVNERIPVQSMIFGTECVYKVIQRFGTGSKAVA